MHDGVWCKINNGSSVCGDGSRVCVVDDGSSVWYVMVLVFNGLITETNRTVPPLRRLTPNILRSLDVCDVMM